MKNLCALLLGLASSVALTTYAVLPLTQASTPLPDYDARPAGPTKSALAQQAPSVAELALQARIPGVTVSRDHITRTPRWLAPRRGFLTPPIASTSSPNIEKNRVGADAGSDVVKTFVDENAAVLGHDSSLFQASRVVRDHATPHNRLRTIVWEQTHNGVPVFEGLFVAHVTRAGELVSIADRFLPALETAVSSQTGKLATGLDLSAAQALSRAVSNAGGIMDPQTAVVRSETPGPERKQVLTSAGIAGPAWCQLVWLPLSETEAQLCWRVVFNLQPSGLRYLSLVDAEKGQVLLRRSLNIDLQDASYMVYTGDSPTPMTPSHPTPLADQPPVAQRTLEKLSALSTNASPLGWIADNDRITTGNNAVAFLDRDLDMVADGPVPNGGSDRIFDFRQDLAADPRTYSDSAVVQLFYRANWFHDRLYDLGFTEEAGNYQTSNLGRGGEEGDAVVCLTQAGAAAGYSDNAAFQPAPDGVPGYVLMFVWNTPSPQRDGSLDQQVVIHELTHGLTTRMVGAGVGIYRLQSRGLGEGWSDFYSLALLGEEADDPDACYAVGSYAVQALAGLEENYYYGIRRYPYSTDLEKNPLTLRDIDPRRASDHRGIPVSPVFGGTRADSVHNMGEIWCAVLWEVHATLVKKLGWQQGNQLALQLVTDGLRLAPENPTYTEARDAIIQADEILTGGSDYEELWAAFAKRGFGFSAVVPESDTSTGVTEAFDLPPDIAAGVEDGQLELRITPPTGSVLFSGDELAIHVKVSDKDPVTNAVVSARSSTEAITFRNDGQEPDSFESDNTYSGTMNVPLAVDTVVVDVSVSAPEKENATSAVTYYIIPAPVNDEFSKAVKVPAAGASYFTSNRRASLQDKEPLHAGLGTASASLWYNYAAPQNGKILVDTGGSDFATVVAVYTNSTLDTLREVASAVGSLSAAGRKGAYLSFDARAGVVYRIAISGSNSRSLGNLRLWIGLGGVPDTNSPVAVVTSPQSGLVVTTNRIRLMGGAVDSEPNPSGIRQIQITTVSMSNPGEPQTTFVDPMPSFDGPVSTNWTAILGLGDGINRVTVSAVDFAGNRSAPVNLDITYRVLDPVNDFFARPTLLEGASGVASANTTAASREAGEPNHAGYIGGKSAWWKFTAPTDGVLSLNTTNSTFDTVLAMYTGDKLSALVPVASNDDASPDASGGYSRLDQPVRGSNVYHIAVDGYDGSGGAMFLEHAFVAQPVYRVNVTSGQGGSVSSSVDVQMNGTAIVAATAEPNYQFDTWEGSLVSRENPISLVVTSNVTLNARFVALPVSDGFESGNLATLAWTSAGAQPWFVDSANPAAGNFAARSGAINHGGSSSLLLTATFRAGTGSFEYRVDCEPTWDRLAFYFDGRLMQQWSGAVSWTKYSFPVSAGIHTFEWRYTKDALNSAGADAAFLDNVNLPFAPVVPPAPPTLRLSRATDGLLTLEVAGESGTVYTIQSSPDLVQWADRHTGPAQDGTLRYTDPNPPTQAAQYYRAMVQP